MTGKEETVEEEEVQEPQEPESEAQTGTLTQEERDEILKQARDEAFEQYKGIQRVIAQKDKEIAALKRLADSKSTTTSLARDEILLAEMKARQTEFGESNPRIAQLETALALERQHDQQAQQEMQREQYTQTWREKLEQRISSSGLDPEGEQFEDFWDYFQDRYRVDGEFERADKKLDRILKGVKPVEKPGVKKENPEVNLDEIRKEERRKVMDEYGLLETDTSLPSGVNRDFQAIESDFVAGKISDEDYEKARQKYRKY